MTDPRSFSHADHDALLIAAHAAGDLTGRDQQSAAKLIAGCPDCAGLHEDLVALAHATARLPGSPRPREFTLTPDDAARLRRGGWRRLLGFLAGPRFAPARPVGAAFAALGIAGLLLASLPVAPFAASTAGAAGERLEYQAARTPASLDTAAGAGVEEHQLQATDVPRAAQAPGPDEADDGGQALAGGGQDLAADPGAAREAAIGRTADTTLAILSGSFLIVGVVLVGLRWSARRFGD